ncbi:initiation factor 2B-like protein [Archaeoglobus veneficus]|uniref:Initiation factor 2B related protein n=1 Tax=Archaeoglobus veneficus (strain DSM 11195 / SNP6) TaxID=693661 RepID=F2KQ33_ARCVS|nr:initiation factor 2B-like protein [Archaeoglobus veneficus]AEA47636.1 initiation factor 2B related protein [Archaeoglobus veneficus SNP6]
MGLSIKDITEDRRSGSSRIIEKALKYLEGLDRESQVEAARQIASAHPSMAGLVSIMKLLEMYDVGEVRKMIEEMNERAGSKLAELVEGKRVVIISRSHIVERGLYTAKKVFVLRSEPGGEGVDAYEFLKRKVESELVFDAEMGYAVMKSDVVVCGADAISMDGFVNKVGTLPLALTAKYLNRPFYVVAPSYKAGRLRVVEPFEFAPADLATLITEDGTTDWRDVSSV